MDATPPSIPMRSKYRDRRRSLSANAIPRTGANDANRIQVQPASPEVISSLITSLSIISSPANDLFENPNGSLSLPTSPALRKSVRATERTTYHTSSRPAAEGSFGIDYGAFNQPSLQQLQEEELLDELAASPPVIKTSKPPSGFSPLTAPKSPRSRDPSPFKNFIRSNSRRSSMSSTDEVASIGSPSVEPGAPPSRELRRQPSGESWSKKTRNQKGLMYMSSKERLRTGEQDRRSGSLTRAKSADRLQLPKIELDSFMAQIPINEEPPIANLEAESSSALPHSSTTAGQGNVSPGLGGGSGGVSPRPIPTRDSSLRNLEATRKKRSSHRSSHRSSQVKGKEKEEANIPKAIEPKRGSSLQDRGQRNKSDTMDYMTAKLHEPLSTPQTTRTQAMTTTDEVHEGYFDDLDEGAPSPAVAQRRRSRQSETGSRNGSRNRRSGAVTPDVTELTHSKSNASKLKRLSAPLSPTIKEKERDHQRTSSHPMSGKQTTSPEPILSSQLHADDRQSNADSIDEAVESYLRSPRLSQKIKHPQTGRTISFSEVGDSEGHAVFCCVGMGLTRYIMAFYDELALTLKLRLITPDRPGVGESESYSDGTGTPLSWPDDVYTICQTLKITKFSILAHSAGAIYALATALRMPQHIRGRIHLLAPWIPPSQMNVIGTQQVHPPANSIPTSQRILRALPTPMLKVANSSFMSATSSSLTSSLPKSPRRSKRRSTTNNRDLPSTTGLKLSNSPGPDKENHHSSNQFHADGKEMMERDAQQATNLSPAEAATLAAATNALADKERQMNYDTRLTHAIWELATTGANPAVDLLVCLERRHTIGFRYVDITRPVVIHHGSRDTRVPVENVKWLGKTMRKCEVRILEGEGHGLMASAAVMGSVLMEISREWDDWVRVTTNKSKEDRSRTLRERASVGAFR